MSGAEPKKCGALEKAIPKREKMSAQNLRTLHRTENCDEKNDLLCNSLSLNWLVNKAKLWVPNSKNPVSKSG